MTLYLKNLGKIGEQKAVNYLKKGGFSILKRNFRSYGGEIDIIAKKDNSIYFIEVKTRSNLDHGAPYEAVNKRKIYHIKKAAQYYLLKNSYPDYRLKIGVFSILIGDKKINIKFWDDIDS